MLKKGIFLLTSLFAILSLTSCGGRNKEKENFAASGAAVSGQPVRSVSTQAVRGKATESRPSEYADSEDGDRINWRVEPKRDTDEQIAVILENKDVWNMGKENPDETFEEAYYVSEFDYALTDLDRDGLLEILVYATQGTGCFTDFAIYEVDDKGKTLVKWDIVKEGLAKKRDVAADFYEYPMTAYLDKKTGNYHYHALDHIHASAAEGEDYLLDMEVAGNALRVRVITYSAYEPDGKYESEDDLKLKTDYFNSEGTKISEKESEERLAAYYQGMEQRYMFYRPYDIKSQGLRNADEEYMEELEWELQDSWYAFAIEEIRRDTDFEASLSDDVKRQIKTIMNHKNGLEQYDDDVTFVEYAVTDFDRDGKLELTVATIQGSGRYCYYSMYEVAETGRKLVRWKQKIKEGDSAADICNSDKVTTYTDKASGIIYYMFKDFIHISTEENYTEERSLFIQDNTVGEDGEFSVSEQKSMKKGTQRIGWRYGYGYDIRRMYGDFLYDELVASWKVFSEK